MSRFFSPKYSSLEPYTPGEQPRDKKYIKLNTNESPFEPYGDVLQSVAGEIPDLRLYSDPECTQLREKLAAVYGVKPSSVIITNGSDEALNFAFMAFAESVVFPDITYGFYPVFADLNGIPYEEIPLKEDLRIDVSDYMGVGKTAVIANPNAPTGLALSLADIERIVSSNPDNVVVIDEAYVDFGAQSAVKLTDKYDNLLVVQTFSKSRSLAGARLGFAIGNESLIADMNTIRYSTNPYNINRMSMAAGMAVLADEKSFRQNCAIIAKNRDATKKELEELGFEVTDSKTNFLFARSDRIEGKRLYTELKKRGVLVRRFDKQRIKDYIRITVGTAEQMRIFTDKVKEILEECGK